MAYYFLLPARLLHDLLQTACLSISGWVLIHRVWLEPLTSPGSSRLSLVCLGLHTCSPSYQRACRWLGWEGGGGYAYTGCTNAAAEVKAMRNYWLSHVAIPILELLGIVLPKWCYGHRKGFTTPETVLQAEKSKNKGVTLIFITGCYISKASQVLGDCLEMRDCLVRYTQLAMFSCCRMCSEIWANEQTASPGYWREESQYNPGPLQGSPGRSRSLGMANFQCFRGTKQTLTQSTSG